MANFAKTQLLKYGWTEGKGLGKNENGIKDPIKANLKFDTAGIGHKETDLNWWESAFNKAANNISVKTENHGVSFDTQSKNEETKKSSVEEQKSNKPLYRNFLKTSTFHDGKTIGGNLSEEEPEKSGCDISLLTDEELLQACGGRTAHKGARHGLNLSGKLERIAKQEEELLKTMSLHSWNKSRNTRKQEAKEMKNLSKVLSRSCSLNETDNLKFLKSKEQSGDIELTVLSDDGNKVEEKKYHKPCCRKKKLKNQVIDSDLMKRFVRFSEIIDRQFVEPSENGDECNNFGDSNKKKKKKRKRHRDNVCDDNENESNKDNPLNFKVKKRKKYGDKFDNVDLVEQLNRVSISEESFDKNKSDSSIKDENESKSSKKKKKKRRHTISEGTTMIVAQKLNNRIYKKKRSRLRQKEKAMKMEEFAQRLFKSKNEDETSSASKLEIVAREMMAVSLSDIPVSITSAFTNTKEQKTKSTNEPKV